MTIKRVWIAQHERALVWENKMFTGVLEPGKHWLVKLFGTVDIQVYDLTVPEFEHPRVDFLVKEARSAMENHFHIVELTDSEAGLVFKNGKLTNVQNIPTQGHIPRGMSLDPDGTHLLTGNQNSDTITIFDRDTKTGMLTFASQMTDIPTAVCILFTPID
jgi:hypothetical protein